MSDGQKQALRDAYTTLRAMRETMKGDSYAEMRTLCETSEYLLVAEFPEVKELELAIERAGKS